MSSHSRRRGGTVLLCLAVSGVWLAAAPVFGGTLTYFWIYDDASSGLNSAKTYTHAIDFGDNSSAPLANVNGVQFAPGRTNNFFIRTPGTSGTVGTGSTNIPNSHPGNGINGNATPTGNVRNLLDDFIYNAPSTVIKLTGLTVGQTYDFRLYGRIWGGDRTQQFGFDVNGIRTPEDTVTLNPDSPASYVPGAPVPADGSHVISYTYTALYPTLTITANQLGAGTFHLYGLTNEVTGSVVPDLVKPVNTIFNTGVDNLGRVLAPGSADPHYTVTSVPPGSPFAVPGASVVQQNNGAWLGNDAVGSVGSSWTSVNSNGNVGVLPGTYVTRTTFDLSGFLPETARVYGRISGDDNVVDVRLNGVSLGITGSGFNSWKDFTIPVGSNFGTITNTLEFVWNNGGATDNPAGFRAELVAMAERRTPRAIPGLFNTGVDNNGTPLPSGVGSIDPHYTITVNPDGSGPSARVQDDPAIPGAWLPNSATSKWIGPQFNTSASAGGDYTYETTFDLTGFYPATAEIRGMWATDNAGLEILLNGQSIYSVSNGFGVLTPFTIPVGSPFQAGVNTLTFRLNNASQGYTGLRVEGLAGTAVAIPEPSSLALLGLAGMGLIVVGWRRKCSTRSA